MKEALAFAAEGKVKANIETAALEDVNQVLERLRTGKVTGRIVLKIQAGASRGSTERASAATQ